MHLRTLLAAAGLGNAEVFVHGAGPEHAGFGPSDPYGDGREGPVVTGVVMASAEVGPGSLFACVKGARADGHDFAADAVQRGAAVLLCERRLSLGAPQVLVPSVRRVIGPVAAAFWSHPASSMRVVGVTGTNGKTTLCALLASIFDVAGWRTGVIGTLTGERTTPEAPALQQRLAELRESGSRAVAMEVSSHALDQFRVAGTEFAAAVFTNLSQDHLDYHEDMESYFEAKAKLFTREQVHLAVVNRADPWGARLVERLAGGPVPLATFSPDEASDVVLGLQSASFAWRGEQLELAMGGRFNVTNAVAAALTARELGLGWDAVAEGLATVAPVKGRFEAVNEGQPFAVLVDFAHTPAALAEALTAARELASGKSASAGMPDAHVAATAAGHPAGPGHPAAPGRVIIVFGAGGDRDRAKRPLMGRVAEDLADVVVITSDNPRSEKPLTIIEEVASGLQRADPLVDVDRGQAIAEAIAMAGAGDVVLIAGKGHETGQDFGGGRVEPFDDFEVARAALRSHGYHGREDGEAGEVHQGHAGHWARGHWRHHGEKR